MGYGSLAPNTEHARMSQCLRRLDKMCCERQRLPLVVSEAIYDLSVDPACANAGRTIVVFLRHTRIGVVEHGAG